GPTAHGAAPPRSAFVLAQGQPAPSAPFAPPPASDRPVSVPRTRDYEPIPDLLDIHFDFGQTVIRPEKPNRLDANAASLHANPPYLVLIEGTATTAGPRIERTSSTWISVRTGRGPR